MIAANGIDESILIGKADARKHSKLIHEIQMSCYAKNLWESERTISSILSLSEHSLVASLDGVLLGYVLAHPFTDPKCPVKLSKLDDIDNNGKYFFIHDLAVHPGSRRQGIAAFILERLLETVKGQFDGVYLVSLAGAKKFWYTYGFVDYTEETEWDYKALYGADSQYMFYQGIQKK
jgi:GNAT superfamily N-acetyltransferase